MGEKKDKNDICKIYLHFSFYTILYLQSKVFQGRVRLPYPPGDSTCWLSSMISASLVPFRACVGFFLMVVVTLCGVGMFLGTVGDVLWGPEIGNVLHLATIESCSGNVQTDQCNFRFFFFFFKQIYCSSVPNHSGQKWTLISDWSEMFYKQLTVNFKNCLPSWVIFFFSVSLSHWIILYKEKCNTLFGHALNKIILKPNCLHIFRNEPMMHLNAI